MLTSNKPFFTNMVKKHPSDTIDYSSKQAKKPKTVKNTSQNNNSVKIPDTLCWGSESDGFVKTWQLITELEKCKNATILFGKVAGEVWHPILILTHFPEKLPFPVSKEHLRRLKGQGLQLDRKGYLA